VEADLKKHLPELLIDGRRRRGGARPGIRPIGRQARAVEVVGGFGIPITGEIRRSIIKRVRTRPGEWVSISKGKRL